MTKYNFEFKKKIVLEYLNEGIGYITLAKKYNIKSKANIIIWVSKYKKYVDEGLFVPRKKEKYSFKKNYLL